MRLSLIFTKSSPPHQSVDIEGALAGPSPAELPHELFHLFAGSQDAVDVGHLGAAAAGDAAPAGAVDTLRVRPLGAGHRADDRLHPADLLLGLRSGDLVLHGGAAGEHRDDAL